MTYTDVKTDTKTIGTKRPGECIIKKLREVPSKLEIQCKKGVHFHLMLLAIPSSIISMSIKNWGLGQSFIYFIDKICFKHAETYLFMGPNID